MSDLLQFPITKKWPPRDVNVIQLYSYPTPNGVKISIALEEMGLNYEAHLVTLSDADVKSPEFLSLNPNNKIPALIDPNGPDGTPIGLFESAAILIYLGEKTGKFIGTNATQKYETIQWLSFQIGGIGPMFGQLGYFVKFAGAEIEDPRPRERYVDEAIRLLAVVEKQLDGRDWITGDYSIADMAIAPWLNGLDYYGAQDMVGWGDLKNIQAYVERFGNRPAVEKGKSIPAG